MIGKKTKTHKTYLTQLINISCKSKDGGNRKISLGLLNYHRRKTTKTTNSYRMLLKIFSHNINLKMTLKILNIYKITIQMLNNINVHAKYSHKNHKLS